MNITAGLYAVIAVIWFLGFAVIGAKGFNNTGIEGTIQLIISFTGILIEIFFLVVLGTQYK